MQCVVGVAVGVGGVVMQCVAVWEAVESENRRGCAAVAEARMARHQCPGARLSPAGGHQAGPRRRPAQPARRQLTATPLSCALKDSLAAISRSGPFMGAREGSHTAGQQTSTRSRVRSAEVKRWGCFPAPPTARTVAASSGWPLLRQLRLPAPPGTAAAARRGRATCQRAVCAGGQQHVGAAGGLAGQRQHGCDRLAVGAAQLGVHGHCVGADEEDAAARGAHSHDGSQPRLHQ